MPKMLLGELVFIFIECKYCTVVFVIGYVENLHNFKVIIQNDKVSFLSLYSIFVILADPKE